MGDMKMRRFIGLGIAALLLSACNQPSQAPGDTAPPTAEAPTVQDAVAPAPYNQDFPTGMEPPFAYSIRSRKVEGAEGGPLRKLVIEFKEGDAATVDRQIEELLTGKGYKRYKTLTPGQDIVGDYGNKGKRITVTTTPADGRLQLAEGSLGTVYFVWND